MMQPAVWIPPASQDIGVKVVRLSEDVETRCLVYPVPPAWQAVIEITAARIYELSAAGWELEPDCASLLDDFLQLGRYWEAERTPDVIEEETMAVQAFAQKWGPT